MKFEEVVYFKKCNCDGNKKSESAEFLSLVGNSRGGRFALPERGGIDRGRVVRQ
jgi:hypothetical protein